MLVSLLLSQLSPAYAESGRKYLRIGENPVEPGLVLQGEKIFSLEDDILLTTIDRNRKKHTGWLSNRYHLVGTKENGGWRAIRIYECGNPILSPRISLRDPNPKPSGCSTGCGQDKRNSSGCKLDGGDWFYWSVGGGLIGYGIGAKESVPAGVGGGLIVVERVTEYGNGSNRKSWKCRFLKKGLLGLASGAIGWLVGHQLYKPKKQEIPAAASSSSGGPGPVPPNGVILRF